MDIEFSHLPGLIDQYTEMAACQYAGYQYYSTWRDITWEERASLVAFYLLQRLVENNRQDAIAQAASEKGK